MHLIGILLAAGRSTRMGRPKQLLPWPPKSPEARPLVAAAFDAVGPACCAMVVVVGHEADAVVAALGERRFERVDVEPAAEMLESIQAGLRAARQMQPTADVLVHPADHPDVGRETLDALVAAAAEHPGRAVMPEFEGRGGHPVLIPAPLVPSIMAYQGPGGLRQFWLDHAEQCVRLAVADASVIADVDTPAEYRLGVQ